MELEIEIIVMSLMVVFNILFIRFLISKRKYELVEVGYVLTGCLMFWIFVDFIKYFVLIT
jgi:hypothetical protein